jgi:putative hemolysin
LTVFTWLVIAVLIAFNGLYVAAEFAAVSVRRSRIRQLAEEGDRLAAELLPTLEDGQRLDAYIAACQVGITISSLVLGAYGQATLGQALTPAFERWGDMQGVAAQSTSAAVILVSLTVLQMVLGELVPKSVTLQYPTRLARLTVLPMRWSKRLLSWFVAILNGSGWAVLRLLGVESTGHQHLHSPEEIRFLIAESREGGYLRPEEQKRLNRALGLAQRTARELMVPRTEVEALSRDLPFDEAVTAISDSPFTRFLVYGDSLDEVVGIVHAKDLAAARLAGDQPSSLEPLLRPILAVHETVSVDRVLSLMREQHGVMAVVVDDFGGTSGIITTEDILTELLGEVGDEFKAGDDRPLRLPDGRIRLPGRLPLYQADRWVGVRWTGESDTVGGLVVERLGRLPEPGTELELGGLAVEVEEVEQYAVRSILVTPREAGADARGEGSS